MRSDDMLYRAFLGGDTSSYDELLIRYGDVLTGYLNGYLHDWQDAEDLMVEAFARIMVKRPQIREGGFKAYLFKTARNLAARFHHRMSRLDLFSPEEAEPEAGTENLPEENLRERERKRTLNECLRRIDPALREALWLVYAEDLSYADAATVMGVSRKRVDKLLQRGKNVLRKELEKEGITNAYE